MRKFISSICTILILTLTACGSNSTPTPLPTLVLGSETASNSNTVSASGQVVPARKAQLSFPMTGTVKTINIKTGDSVRVGQSLAILDTTLLESKVKESQANVDAAQAQLHYQIRIGTDQEHLASAQADIDRAQAQLDSAKATLAQGTLSAPFAGTIAELDVSPSETVTPGQIVIVLGDLTKFQIVTTDLSERDIRNVQSGQNAVITIVALNQQQFTGKVSEVARIASSVGGDVVYKVTIDLDQQPPGLRWGMTANVNIQTGK